MMTTPTDDSQNTYDDKKEPGEKGGVAGTDSKDFNSGGPIEQDPGPENG